MGNILGFLAGTFVVLFILTLIGGALFEDAIKGAFWGSVIVGVLIVIFRRTEETSNTHIGPQYHYHAPPDLSQQVILVKDPQEYLRLPSEGREIKKKKKLKKVGKALTRTTPAIDPYFSDEARRQRYYNTL